jgi:hypothetical protein
MRKVVLRTQKVGVEQPFEKETSMGVSYELNQTLQQKS